MKEDLPEVAEESRVEVCPRVMKEWISKQNIKNKL